MDTNIITKKLSLKKLKSYPLQANRFHLSSFRNLPPTTYHLPPTTYHLPPTRGFTLIEMLVSISVFMVVMLVAASSLLSIIDGNSKAQSLKSAINNLNFAIESMQKNIRVGTSYLGRTSCSLESDTCIGFVSYKDSDNDSNKDYVLYRYNNQSIEKCISLTGSATCSNFTRLTAPEVKITSMKFYIDNSSQPRVLITVSGEAGTKQRIKTNFNLQTTVSQRSF